MEVYINTYFSTIYIHLDMSAMVVASKAQIMAYSSVGKRILTSTEFGGLPEKEKNQSVLKWSSRDQQKNIERGQGESPVNNS